MCHNHRFLFSIPVCQLRCLCLERAKPFSTPGDKVVSTESSLA